VSENRLLRRVFGLVGDRRMEKNEEIKSFIICTLHQILLG
jgi:hypothetical protein